MTGSALARFAAEYGLHRQAEGRGYEGAELVGLPYLRSGPLARQWAVRARSFEALRDRLIRPLSARLGRPLSIADLGAGNGWLSHRLVQEGHAALALDIREDEVDGLGAGCRLAARLPDRMTCVAGAFDAVPIADAKVDVAVFNASLHYATDLERALAEAARITRPGGCVAILDSPFYRREADGAAMVTEKKAGASERFGARAEALLGLPFVEFLTRERLARASASLGLFWRRSLILYPLWYELRPVRAALRGERRPSRFDLWIGERQ